MGESNSEDRMQEEAKKYIKNNISKQEWHKEDTFIYVQVKSLLGWRFGLEDISWNNFQTNTSNRDIKPNFSLEEIYKLILEMEIGEQDKPKLENLKRTLESII